MPADMLRQTEFCPTFQSMYLCRDVRLTLGAFFTASYWLWGRREPIPSSPFDMAADETGF